jgi:hypothetical protein
MIHDSRFISLTHRNKHNIYITCRVFKLCVCVCVCIQCQRCLALPNFHGGFTHYTYTKVPGDWFSTGFNPAFTGRCTAAAARGSAAANHCRGDDESNQKSLFKQPCERRYIFYPLYGLLVILQLSSLLLLLLLLWVHFNGALYIYSRLYIRGSGLNDIIRSASTTCSRYIMCACVLQCTKPGGRKYT